MFIKLFVLRQTRILAHSLLAVQIARTQHQLQLRDLR